jgi:aspartate aminotransferase-like enzyme
MNPSSSLQFKIATEDWEFELIHRLNYRTFVEEIPQHQENSDHRLVDRFHHQNTYFICLYGGTLIGMIAGRTERPFSLDQKLPELDSYLPIGRRVCEIRLLAVEKKHRNGQVFGGLLSLLTRHYIQNGFDLGVISGTTRQLKLYKKLGFIPFGPLLGTGDALFQPMYLTLEAFEEKARAIARNSLSPAAEVPRLNFLPGPVGIHAEVRRAFFEDPVSHRTDSFIADFRVTRKLLSHLVKARDCQMFLGSGTLANDIIAGQLSLEPGPGLVLSNGEFGERLVDHARRFGLKFDVGSVPWGETFARDTLAAALTKTPGIRWLWAVHCETSTGILNPIHLFKDLAREHGVKLCLDCISSIGTVPVDLTGVALASCVSGKGLGSFTGLSMVFHQDAVKPAPERLPRYLDLGYYARYDSIPFTQSSNLFYAVQVAVQRVAWQGKFRDLAQLGTWFRAELRQRGYRLIAPESDAAPAVVTVALPSVTPSVVFGKQLEQNGFLLSYGSEYLRVRNWVQICLMGECSRDNLVQLLAELDKSPPK